MTATTDLRPVIALDVGGTSMKGALVDSRGDMISPLRWGTPRGQGPEPVVSAVLHVVETLASNHPEAAAVGLVVPGLVDEDRGVALSSENIGWHDVPFTSLVTERVGLPVGFGHDVRAGGVAERRFGSGDSFQNTLFMPIGTGISGAMFIEGRFARNPHAGEIGHIAVGFPDACVCGATGCLEAVASAASIARRFVERGGIGADDSLSVLAFARDGDPVAVEVWADAVEALARALTTYISLLAPELIVLAGGLSQAGDALAVPVRDRVRELLVWQREPQIIASSLGGRASCLGASILAYRELNRRDKEVM